MVTRQFGRVVSGTGFRRQSARAWAPTPQLLAMLAVYRRKGATLGRRSVSPLPLPNPLPSPRAAGRVYWAWSSAYSLISGKAESGELEIRRVQNPPDFRPGRQEAAAKAGRQEARGKHSRSAPARTPPRPSAGNLQKPRAALNNQNSQKWRLWDWATS